MIQNSFDFGRPKLLYIFFGDKNELWLFESVARLFLDQNNKCRTVVLSALVACQCPFVFTFCFSYFQPNSSKSYVNQENHVPINFCQAEGRNFFGGKFNGFQE